MPIENYKEENKGIIRLSGLKYKFISSRPTFNEQKEAFEYSSSLYYDEDVMRDFTLQLKNLMPDTNDSEIQKYLLSFLRISKKNERVCYITQSTKPIFDYKNDVEKDFTAIISVSKKSFTDETGKDIVIYGAKGVKVKLTPEKPKALLAESTESNESIDEMVETTFKELTGTESDELPFS